MRCRSWCEPKVWTTYELSKQSEISLQTFWKLSTTRLYAEAKRLAEDGLATATKDYVGRRPRTIYESTDAGRRELTRWLNEPGSGLSIDFEALAKVFFADQGGIDGLRSNLEVARDWAATRIDIDTEATQRFLDGGAEFPERLAVLALVGGLLTELTELVERWANWALEITDDWPDDPSHWPVETNVFQRAAQRERRRPEAERGHEGS